MKFEEFFDEAKHYLQIDEAAKTYTVDAKRSGEEYGVKAREALWTVLDNMFRKDEVLSAAITTKVDSIPAFWFAGTNERNSDRLKRLWTRKHERHLWYNLFLYGNAFYEIERNGTGTPVAIHAVEPFTIEIHDPSGHGEVTHYTQRWVEPNVRIPAKDMMHFTLDKITTELWGEIPVQPLASYVALKHFVKGHVTRLFRNNDFRSVLTVPESAKKEQIQTMLGAIKDSAKHKDRPFVLFGESSLAPMMDFDDAQNFKEWIQLADNGILMHMQVPPIMAGMPDNSGRSSGEQQTYKAFNAHIEGSIKYHQDDWVTELEKIGVTGVEKKYGLVDKKGEKDVLEMAERLNNLGAKPEKLQEWMEMQGIALPDAFFDKKQEVNPALQDGGQPKSDDMYPSRRPKAEGEMNERVGTGSEGETREDQLIDEASIRYQILDPRVLERAKKYARVIQ